MELKEKGKKVSIKWTEHTVVIVNGSVLNLKKKKRSPISSTHKGCLCLVLSPNCFYLESKENNNSSL